jgi:hypothetical protein
MTIYVCDQFNLSAINRDTQHAPRSGHWDDTIVRSTRVPVPITSEQARKLVSYSDNRVSTISDVDVAAVYSDILRIPLQTGGADFKLQPKDVALIGLRTGVKELSDEFIIEWWTI